MHIRFGEGEAMLRVEIPYEIVKARDCTKYQEWIHDNYVAPGFIASDRCPWRTPPKGPIGEFILKDVNVPFWVPREYLAFDKQEPDGVTDGIYVWMAYPNMTPTTEEDEKDNRNISLYIDVNRFDRLCKETPQYCSNRQQQWWGEADFPYMLRGDGKEFVDHQKINHLKQEKLDEYIIEGIRYGIYVRGSFEKPEVYYKCNKFATNPGCHSSFNYNNKIFVRYRFNRKLLPFHDGIRVKIQERIAQWLNKGEEKND